MSGAAEGERSPRGSGHAPASRAQEPRADGATNRPTDGPPDGAANGSPATATNRSTCGSRDGSTNGTHNGPRAEAANGSPATATNRAAAGSQGGSPATATDGSRGGAADGPTDGAPDGSPGGRDAAVRSRRRLAFGLCTAVTAIAFEAVSVATAMPAAARDLDGLALYAWAFSLFLIGQLFATVAAGRLCDRIGPARPMLGGMVIFALGLVVAATSPTMVQLVCGRLLQGLGSGAMAVATYVVIAQAVEEAYRPTMFSWFSTAWVLPSFVGPTVAAFLTHHLGWRAVFWAVLPVLALGALMTLPQVFAKADSPATTQAGQADETARPATMWAAGMAAVGATAVQLAGQRVSLWGLGLGVLGLALVAASLPNLMPRGFFRFRPGLPPVITVRTLMAGAFFGAESFVPLMLVEQRHLSLLLAGTTLTVGSLGWTIGSWVQSRPWLPLARQQVISLGAASVTVGIVVVVAVAWFQPWVGLVAVGWTFAGLGMGLATASTSVATMALSTPTEQGRNASSLQFGEAFGGGFFIGIGGTVFASLRTSSDLTTTFTSVLAVMAGVGLLAVLASLRTGPVESADATG